MGISGLIGAGATDALDDIIVQRLAQQKFQEQVRAQQAQEAIQQARIAQDAQQHGDMVKIRGREMDFRDTQANEEMQQSGIADMRAQQERQRVNLTRINNEEESRAAEEAFNADQTVPARVRKLFNAQKIGVKNVTDEDFMDEGEIAAKNKQSVDHARAVADAQAGAAARYRSAPEPPSMTPGQKFGATQSLRKSFDLESRAAREVGMQLRQMQAGIDAAKRGDMAAGSQAVLVTFQKILDPVSVVRESEYARSSAGQALLSRIQGAAEQLQKGGASVPVPELEKFVQLATTFAANQARAAAESKTQIEAIAREYGIDPALVTRDVDGPGESAPAPPAGATPTRRIRMDRNGNPIGE
jgi:hypothetical protein